jgi:hypothetical protein
VVIELGDVGKAGQATRCGRSLQRTCKYLREGELSQLFANFASALLSALVERQVGAAGFLIRIGPGRVAVPGEKQSWQVEGHDFDVSWRGFM